MIQNLDILNHSSTQSLIIHNCPNIQYLPEIKDLNHLCVTGNTLIDKVENMNI